ncbi:MAG: Na+:solute symporter [Calditrichaeota bacterium]|nr:MAG: Na+:solute symporter [Calditrichota bacterium]MBL1205604.1 Na+:solute symporter [Calditrichota bacterium]NOG45432.1 Na+:solute symporter [Calditrichota bacterium]
MTLQLIDWVSIIGFFAISLGIGLSVAKRAGSNTEEFFASGRSMPWWLLGVSMVATTFSADTPNLVTDLVRQHGVSGNWMWWAFLLTGMVTVFIYAKLWRRSEVLTDVEFYELRYSGKAAAFLRGFRALYLGIFFNVVIMATVLLAAIKIGGVMLGLTPFQTIFWASLITVVYSMLGGLRGVLITDFIQFSIAMIGAVYAAYIVVNLPEVGGIENLLANPLVQGKISLLPDFSDTNLLMTVLIIPIAVQWWSVWYPGAEPGGGGYVAQRMLAAKDEKNAMGATLFFNLAHYALRPWPWILVALASLVVFPDLDSLGKAFPNIDAGILKNDLAYSAMLTYLPAGILGIVVASLIAAVMSTISTHLNWGASYVVNDFYKRFVKQDPSEKEQVLAGRLTILVLMILAAILALFLSNALQAFHILLQIGAGTGLLFLLRWFWWRINAASEIAAMVISFLVAIYFEIVHPELGLPEIIEWQRLVIGVAITTIGWVTVTLFSKPTDQETLFNFCKKVTPGGPCWKRILEIGRKEGHDVDALLSEKWDMPSSLLGVFLGLLVIYNGLFAIGFWLYGNIFAASITTVVSILSSVFLIKLWANFRVR